VASERVRMKRSHAKGDAKSRSAPRSLRDTRS
jgi:hypothetical protein